MSTLAELLTRREALRMELVEFAAHIHDIRATFGNPFCYSSPEHADEGPGNFSGYSSHAVALPMVLEFQRIEAEIRRLTAEDRG